MKMKLSEAIFMGSLLRPQIHGAYLTKDGSCALGAALEATGTKPWDLDVYVVGDAHRRVAYERFPPLRSMVKCPDCPCRFNLPTPTYELSHIIIHLNDAHLWNREKIADWVAENIERNMPPAAEELVLEECTQ